MTKMAKIYESPHGAVSIFGSRDSAVALLRDLVDKTSPGLAVSVSLDGEHSSAPIHPSDSFTSTISLLRSNSTGYFDTATVCPCVVNVLNSILADGRRR